MKERNLGLMMEGRSKESYDDFITNIIIYQFELNLSFKFILKHVVHYYKLFKELPSSMEEIVKQ